MVHTTSSIYFIPSHSPAHVINISRCTTLSFEPALSFNISCGELHKKENDESLLFLIAMVTERLKPSESRTEEVVPVNQALPSTHSWVEEISWPKLFQSSISQFTEHQKKVPRLNWSHLSRQLSIYGIAFVDGEVTVWYRRALMNFMSGIVTLFLDGCFSECVEMNARCFSVKLTVLQKSATCGENCKSVMFAADACEGWRKVLRGRMKLATMELFGFANRVLVNKHWGWELWELFVVF